MGHHIFPTPWDMADRLEIHRTQHRLEWQYGAAQAAEIVAGDCMLTNLDIARWRALGAPKMKRTADRGL